MIVEKLFVQNLQLIKSAQVDFDKINIISGINKDNPSESGNGSGKSTLILRAILFALYGFVEEGLTLKDLIRFGERECSIELYCSLNGEYYHIVRKIPTELQIFRNNNEIQANTNTIKQEIINEKFGDVKFFRQYRCVDLKNGINVLDMGIVSLRKTLMAFMEDYFSNIRKNLLAKKVERERYSINKKLYKHYLSEKRLDLLNASLSEMNSQIIESKNSIRDTQKSISKVDGEISAKKRIIEYKQNESKKAEEGICPILRTSCDRIGKKMTTADKSKLNQEVVQLNHEIEQLKSSTEGDNDYLADLEMQLQEVEESKQKINEKLMRLKGAFQFADYKYTKADIVIYDEAIKILDLFAGEYIKTWLESLQIIINNLLQSINISIEFVANKDFLLIMDNGQLLKYDQCSSGQKCFLNVIFKLAILMHQNKAGILLWDDGLGSIDFTNLTNLITICQGLPFQIIGIYQNYNNEIENVKQIVIIRKNNESKII